MRTDPEHPLERQAHPADLPTYARHGCCPLTGELEPTHVNYDPADLQALGLSVDELNTYGDLLLDPEGPTIHRLLGYPEQIQPGDMQLDSQPRPVLLTGPSLSSRPAPEVGAG